MYRNLKGSTNRRLLEETGLWDGIKKTGKNVWDKTKMGASGAKQGFNDFNSTVNAAKNAIGVLKAKNEKDVLNNFSKMNENLDNIIDISKEQNLSDDEQKIYNRGRNVGYLTNGLGRAAIPIAGIYGAKKLYDHYTDGPMDNAQDIYTNAMDNAHDVYDGIAG